MPRSTLIVLLVIFLVACSGTVNEAVPSVAQSIPPVRPSSTLPPPVPPSPQPTEPVPLSPTVTLSTPTESQPSPTSTTDMGGQPDLPTDLPDPGAYTWQLVVDGLNAPVGLVHAGDGSGRLFILEQGGQIRILQDGALSSPPFLDIRDRVGSQRSEQGLLGLAFHPLYPQNGYFFVYYTNPQGDTVVARYQASPGDPNHADPNSEIPLLNIPQPYANHNGGMIAFGPDGYLYLGLGDGGSAGDPLGNGQSLDSLLGKILRIDVDNGAPYAIPPDNPFTGRNGQPEIWAYGLRNPWRFAFDHVTGDLYIGDVGQNQWEEINFEPAGSPGGANFGWNYLEGTHPYGGNPPAGINLTAPIAEYEHNLGCSVTGGVVYRGSRLPTWQGVYLYGDYCSGRVWGLLRDALGEWKNALLFENVGQISSFGEDELGEVYLVDHSGIIYTLAER